MADTNETIADIIARKRRLAAEMEETLGDQHSSVELLKDDADRLEAAYKREIDEIKKQVADLRQQLPKPDPNWRDICAKCFENGATEPPDCKYYTEDGCMSPIPDQHPLIQVGNAAKLREAAEFVAHIDDNGYTSHDVQCAIDKARAAIAGPARNCDEYTADKLKAIFKSELVSELQIANEHEKNLITITAMRVIDTLFATAEEGGKNAYK